MSPDKKIVLSKSKEQPQPADIIKTAIKKQVSKRLTVVGEDHAVIEGGSSTEIFGNVEEVKRERKLSEELLLP